MTPEQFAERLAALRVNHSAQEIADALGVDRATLYRWRKAPPADVGAKLMAASWRMHALKELARIAKTLTNSQLRDIYERASFLTM